ncbi:MAG: hypothetical protein ABH859_02690 [Pseudomonadota bacterium]
MLFTGESVNSLSYHQAIFYSQELLRSDFARALLGEMRAERAEDFFYEIGVLSRDLGGLISEGRAGVNRFDHVAPRIYERIEVSGNRFASIYEKEETEITDYISQETKPIYEMIQGVGTAGIFVLAGVLSMGGCAANLTESRIERLGSGNNARRTERIEDIVRFMESDASMEDKRRMMDRFLETFTEQTTTYNIQRDDAFNLAMELARSSMPAELQQRMVETLVNTLQDREASFRPEAVRCIGILIARSDISTQSKERMIESLFTALQIENSYIEDNIFHVFSELIRLDEIADPLKERMLDAMLMEFDDDASNISHALREDLENLICSDISPELKERIIEPMFNYLESNEYAESLSYNVVPIATALIESNISVEQKDEMIDRLLAVINNRESEGHCPAVTPILVALLQSNISIEQKNRIIDEVLSSLRRGQSPQIRSRSALALRAFASSEISIELKVRTLEGSIGALNTGNFNVQYCAISVLESMVESNIPLNLKITLVQPLLDAIVRSFDTGVRGLLDIPFYIADRLISRIEYTDIHFAAINVLSSLVPLGIPVELREAMIEPLVRVLGNGNEASQSSAAELLRTLAGSGISNQARERIESALILEVGAL